MSKHQYSPYMVRKVALQVAQGKELADLAGEPGFPVRFSTLFDWYHARPEFRAAVEAARAFHAEAAVHQMVALSARLGTEAAGQSGGAAAIVKGFGALRMAAERMAGKAGKAGRGAGAAAPRIVQVISGAPAPNDPDGDYDF